MPPIKKVKPEDVNEALKGKDEGNTATSQKLKTTTSLPPEKEEVGFKTDEQEQPSKSVQRRVAIQKKATTEEQTVKFACPKEDCDYVAEGTSEAKARHHLKMHIDAKHKKKQEGWVGGHKMKSEGEDLDRM